MTDYELGGAAVADTFAEAFGMRFTRIVITAASDGWALEAARSATGFATSVIGSPETVRSGLDDLLAATQADEIMATTMVHDPADRLRSFELLAEVTRLSSGRSLAAASA